MARSTFQTLRRRPIFQVTVTFLQLFVFCFLPLQRFGELLDVFTTARRGFASLFLEPFLGVVAIKNRMMRPSQAKLRRDLIGLHCITARLSFTPGGLWRQGKTVLPC